MYFLLFLKVQKYLHNIAGGCLSWRVARLGSKVSSNGPDIRALPRARGQPGRDTPEEARPVVGWQVCEPESSLLPGLATSHSPLPCS